MHSSAETVGRGDPVCRREGALSTVVSIPCRTWPCPGVGSICSKDQCLFLSPGAIGCRCAGRKARPTSGSSADRLRSVSRMTTHQTPNEPARRMSAVSQNQIGERPSRRYNADGIDGHRSLASSSVSMRLLLQDGSGARTGAALFRSLLR